MSPSFIRSNERYAWHGQSLLITNERGDCCAEHSLSGYYFREARHLRTMRIEINGVSPWLCESAAGDADSLSFSYVHPELTAFGGGGSGQSQDAITRDRDGIPHRGLDVVVTQQLGIAALDVTAIVTNRAREPVTLEFAWIIDADFADIQEALGGERQQSAPVHVEAEGDHVEFVYQHDRLSYRTTVSASGGWTWTSNDWRLATTLRLEPQQPARLSLYVQPADYRDMPDSAELDRAEALWRHWREGFARVQTPGNRVAEEVIRANLRDLSSFPLLMGKADEWLAPQAGMPLYPALFGRDAFTAGWQAGWVDRGRMLDAALTRLGRMQSTRVEKWTDEEPGRVPYQVRMGPLARLNINPYAAYYADFASPMMFIISMAHAFAWTGDMEFLDRHWSTALGILQWLKQYGDRDGDGYLEYLTHSPKGTKNQGWKDSGNAILYDDGSPVPAPLGTCELQGYWFASLQLMSALHWTRGDLEQARELWHQAMELKRRFNRDWWMEDESFIALALDADKKQVRALTSNVGQCIATGIIDDEHLPRVVGRLFAPDLFSGWGIRTLSTNDRSYNPVEYHLGSVWAVENASIVFGLARFGFWERAADLAEGLFSLATLYPGYRIPETVGGYARSERGSPGAYPRSNTPQLWNASVFPLLLQSLLGLQPLAPIHTLVADPHLPAWLPAVTIEGINVGDSRASLRFWRDRNGDSHGEILHKTGTLHLLRQPPIESLTQGVSDRLGAAVDTLLHH
ncbi:MAG TPA: glycogen debranching N-terminal domain-containing protein [Gemmatimonadaceae bacterium]|nr:glycogen debranching N-terminal domain-containing protein [Gemmatimonadaceae bacterium]